MKTFAFRSQVTTFLFFVLVVFTDSNVNAQDNPFEAEYTTIFDFQEEDLYINSTRRPKHYSEENSYSTGYLSGYSITAPPTNETSNEYGAPDPPPPPDVPISNHLVYLMISGLALGVVKIVFHKNYIKKLNYLL